MTIVEKIINSIKAALGDGFVVNYHDAQTLNEMVSHSAMPCAMFQLLTTGNAVNEAGQMKERVSAAVFFVEPSQFDFNAVDNERIIDRCKARAFSWLGSLSSDEWLTLTALNRTSRVYDDTDDILTGFGVFVDLTELVGWSDCPTVPYDFNNDFNNDFLIAI